MQSSGRPNILIVEDDPDDREYAQRILAPHYEIEFAADAHEARGKLIGFPPALLLCDIYMPGEPGMDLAEAVLSTRRQEIPVIMVSGMNDPDVQQRARQLGCDGYLVKPYSAEDLLNAVEHALGRGAETETPPEEQPQSTRSR